jgi:hypothetical protein
MERFRAWLERVIMSCECFLAGRSGNEDRGVRVPLRPQMCCGLHNAFMFAGASCGLSPELVIKHRSLAGNERIQTREYRAR